MGSVIPMTATAFYHNDCLASRLTLALRLPVMDYGRVCWAASQADS